MKAGKQFVDDPVEKGLLDNVTRVAVDVYGSLSLTGKGHHTDIAIIMGLAGNEPATVDIDSIPGFIRDVETRERLLLAQGRHEVDFLKDDGMRFTTAICRCMKTGCRSTPGMTTRSFIARRTIPSAAALSLMKSISAEATNEVTVPYPFKSAKEMLEYCNSTGLSLSGMVMQTNWRCIARKRLKSISVTSGKPCRLVLIAV